MLSSSLFSSHSENLVSFTFSDSSTMRFCYALSNVDAMLALLRSNLLKSIPLRRIDSACIGWSPLLLDSSWAKLTKAFELNSLESFDRNLSIAEFKASLLFDYSIGLFTGGVFASNRLTLFLRCAFLCFVDLVLVYTS